MRLQLCRLVKALVEDDGGQDLVEYALLGATVGLASLASFGALQSAVREAYQSWNTGANSIWEAPDPGGF